MPITQKAHTVQWNITRKVFWLRFWFWKRQNKKWIFHSILNFFLKMFVNLSRNIKKWTWISDLNVQCWSVRFISWKKRKRMIELINVGINTFQAPQLPIWFLYLSVALLLLHHLFLDTLPSRHASPSAFYSSSRLRGSSKHHFDVTLLSVTV